MNNSTLEPVEDGHIDQEKQLPPTVYTDSFA